MIKKKLKGSLTIEAAVIVPLVLFVFGVSMYILFYLHDKNILAGAAHETVVCATGYQSFSEGDMESYFQNCIKGKMLLFDYVRSDATVEKEKVSLVCKASKKKMRLQIEKTMKKTNPESYIRKIQRAKKLGEGIREQGEDLLQE